MIVRGRVFATLEEVIDEFFVNLNKDNFSIEQHEGLIVVMLNGVMKAFEEGSLIIK
jgi:hypothetical protein